MGVEVGVKDAVVVEAREAIADGAPELGAEVAGGEVVGEGFGFGQVSGDARVPR